MPQKSVAYQFNGAQHSHALESWLRAGNARGVPVTVGGRLVDSFGAKVLCSRQPAFLLSFWKPIFLARFLIVCFPAALLLIACGLAEIAQLWIRYGLVILMLLSAVAPISSYYAEPGPQDWKSAVGYLALKSGAGDIAILPNGYCEMPVRYYIDHAGKIPSFPAILSAPNGMRRTVPRFASSSRVPMLNF